MDAPSKSIRELANRLLKAEAGAPPSARTHLQQAVRVSEILRISLTKFAGTDGFAALLKRAVALARRDFPSLNSVRVGNGGTLEGLEELSERDGSKVALEIVANLLWLLVTFVGEPITMRLVEDAWANLATEDKK